MNPTSTPSVLSAFENARHERSDTRVGRLVRGAVAIFTVVALVALVTHDRSADAGPGLDIGGDIAATPSNAPSTDGGGSTTPGGRASDGVSPTGGSDAGGASGSGTSGGDGGSGPAPAPGGDFDSDPFTPPPTGPPADSTDVAVASGVLKTFAFGSQVGLPLLCSVAASAVISGAPDPTVAQTAGTIASSCVEFGNQGHESLTALNQQLEALEAINPAATPIINALADTFNSAGSQDVPFADSITSIGELVRFFSGSE